MTAEQFTRLIDSATDEEADAIERAALRAGVWWRCAFGWTNDESDSTCGCGAPKDAALEA